MGSLCNVGRKEQLIRFLLGAGMGAAAFLSPLGQTTRWVILALGILIFVEGALRY